MSTDELRQVADRYVEVAGRLKRCGFGGVELHGRTVISSRKFSRPGQTDEMTNMAGPSTIAFALYARWRKAIRQTCGSDFVIGLKMPGDEGVDGGIDPDEAARITTHPRARWGARLFRLQSG